MTGILFIINVPQKEFENALIKNKKVQKKLLEMTKDEQKSKSNNLNHKSKGEVTLTVSKVQGIDGTNGRCSKRSSSSWIGSDDIRGDKMKSKNKLVITRPVRGVDIVGAFDCDTPLETILSDVINRLDVRNATWCSTQNNKFWQVTFSLEAGGNSEELLQVLSSFGIGTRHQSSLSIVPCTFFYGTTEQKEYECQKPSNTGPWSRFSSSIQARTNLAQVLQSVRADAALTFDWCFLLLVAALVAAIGLVENSTVVLVASMLISPLMGPITAGTLGTAVRDRSLQMIGVTHELLGLLMCLAIGFVFGLVICAVDGQLNIVSDWPTAEMMCRCEYRSLWVGMLIAIPSGAGVALAVLGDYTASLVGVAISASLLPPAVNAGLLWAMSVYSMVYPNDLTWRVEDPMELAVLGSRSLCLTLINIICIYVAGVAVYKVKNVSPLEQRDITWWGANKSRLQASKRLNTTAWEIYSRWPSSQPEKTDAKVHETITFRRPHVLERMKAQSLENCFRHIQTDECYQPLDSEASESQNSDSIKSNETERKTEFSKFCFYNLSCENRESQERPTLEPSQSFTVA